MSDWLAGYLWGLATIPAWWFALLVVEHAAWAFAETRFVLAANWDYQRSRPRVERAWLWRWPVGAVAMFWHEFWRPSPGQTTGLTFTDGTSYRASKWGKATRVQS